jgi:uncharacterized protein (TIGR04222 family)
VNPFNLQGPEFLQFYAALFVVVVGFATLMRWYFQQPAGEPPPDIQNLEPHEIAYLAGGDKLVLNAVLASLVARNVLHVNADAREVSALGAGRLTRIRSNKPFSAL